MLLRVIHGVAQARAFRKPVLLRALMKKASQFQNQSVEESKNFKQTVDGNVENLGDELSEAFRVFHNAWMTYLGVWSETPASPTAREAYTVIEHAYRELSSVSRRNGFSPIASIFKDPATVEAPEDSAKLWRYLDREKFTDLLTTCSLYFCRADLFDEPFEGSIPSNANTRDIYPMPEDREFLNHFFYASCWHMNPHESVAMWRLYLGNEPGVAVQTIAGRLVPSLDRPRHGRVDAGCVEYVDYGTDLFDWYGPINAYFRKRAEYKHEREYRAVYHYFPPDYHSEASRKVLATGALRVGVEDENIDIAMPAGVRIPVDLSFMERVVVSPSAPSDFREWTRAIISETGFTPEVVPSALEQSPRF